jgi:hypothetical protein
MPTILRSGPYRIYFYSHEEGERPHVHVDRERFSAKFWLDPVALAHNRGFRAVEWRRIERLVKEHRDRFWDTWYDYLGH